MKHLTLKKKDDSTDVLIDPISPLLSPDNLALKNEALTLIAKSNHSLDRLLTRDEIGTLVGQKMRLYYDPSITIERCPVMDGKKLGHEMAERAFRIAAWRRFGSSSTFRLKVQFAGEHELVIPFPLFIDISLGDFHWLHLF